MPFRDLFILATDNRAPAEYCAKIIKSRSSITREETIGLLSLLFMRNPEYVAQIARLAGIDIRIMRQLFYFAIEATSRMAWLFSRRIQVAEKVPMDEYDELSLAYAICGVAAQQHMEYGGRLAERGAPRVHPETFSPNVIDKMTTHLISASTCELKAAALGMIMAMSPRSSHPRPYIDAASRMFKGSELEQADHILFSCRSMSLEAISSLGRRRPGAIMVEEGRSYNLVTTDTERGLRENSIFSAFTIKQCRAVLGEKWQGYLSAFGGSERKEGLAERAAGVWRHVRRRQPVDSDMVRDCLRMIIVLLEKRGPQEWRGWQGMVQVTRLGWHSIGRIELELIDQLRNLLVRRIHEIDGRLEVCSIIEKICEAPQPFDLVCKWLELLGELDEGTIYGRWMAGGYDQSQDQKTFAVLAEAESRMSAGQFAGYLKFIALRHWGWTIYNKGNPPLANVPLVRVLDCISSHKGLAREGAIVLLSRHVDFPLEDLFKLLQSAKDDDLYVERMWGWLIEERCRHGNASEVSLFVEKVVSPAMRCGAAIKGAALSVYLASAGTPKEDIREKETELGLPFQTREDRVDSGEGGRAGL